MVEPCLTDLHGDSWRTPQCMVNGDEQAYTLRARVM